MRTKQSWDRWYRRAHWTALRTLVIARDPVCRICERVASTVADHVIPHKGSWNLFCDLDNLWGVCDTCHSKKTASEDGGFGNKMPNTFYENNTAQATGGDGKQFQASTVSASKLDKALSFDVNSLLDGLPE